MYTAHAAIELYAEAFDAVGALDRLEGFASHHGPDFYGLPRNTDRITLHRRAQRVPGSVPFGDSTLVPFRAGEDIAFTLAS
jgi:dihydroorotase